MLTNMTLKVLACGLIFYSDDMDKLMKMVGTKHRVLFQNAEGNINMGVMFNDPNVELGDFYWYNALAEQLEKCLIERRNNEELVSYAKKRGTLSCYVELQRNGLRN